MEDLAGEWVSLSTTDLARVDKIANIIHPGLPERIEVFADKLRLFPSGCLKFMFMNEMVGYGLSHPWRLFSIPPLDNFLGALPADPDCLYMHDVAILPEGRGHQAAGRYVEKIRAIARRAGIQKLACVSVYGSNVLWEKYGFQLDLSPALRDKVAAYGETAKYMTAPA